MSNAIRIIMLGRQGAGKGTDVVLEWSPSV